MILPRSMKQVLSDIESMINNNYDVDAISCDIAQLKAQLNAVNDSVKNRDNLNAAKVMNPAGCINSNLPANNNFEAELHHYYL
jgi:hypothetical protein